MRSIQYIPRTTEKAYSEETKHTYVFYVPMKASKQAIAKQIAEAFKVTVLSVRTIVRKGKPTRFSRGKHAYPGTTTRQDRKVAYITIKADEKIPVFEEAKTESKPADKKAEKQAAKAVEKEAKKTTKKTAKKEDK